MLASNFGRKATALLLLTLASTVAGCSEDDRLSPELQHVVDEVIEPAGLDLDSIAVYRYETALATGDVIEPAAVGDPKDLVPIEVETSSTLYMVDEAPDALFGHPVKYVVVDDATGDTMIVEEEFWPLVNGEPFAPFERQPVLGHKNEVERRAGLDRGTEEPTFREGSSDPCAKKNYAITIDGSGRAVNTDIAEDVMRQEFELRGYDVIRVPYQGDPVKTRDAMFAAFNQLAALGEDKIGELVIYYAGHGVKPGLVFGNGTTQFVAWDEFAMKMGPIDAEDRTLIIEACHSGWVAKHAELLLQDLPGLDDERIRVLAAADEDGIAGVGSVLASGFFSDGLLHKMEDTPRSEPLDFDDPSLYLVDPIQYVYKGKPGVQTPQSALVEPDLARLDRYEHQGECRVSGHIDEQAYYREVRMTGEWFGDTEGHIELQDENGRWVTLQTTYWGNDKLIALVPMRKDGFPYNGKSKDAPDDAAPGHYLARIVKGDGKKSPTSEVYLIKLELQVNTISWTPNYDEYDHPAWNEMWHPFTKGSFTQGPTIQHSYVRIPSDFDPPLTGLDSDVDVDHEVSEYIGWDTFGTWSYELPPGERDLATAYDQRNPDINYYGFRTKFSDDYLDTQTWIWTLAYD
jgi:hypothetical protein